MADLKKKKLGRGLGALLSGSNPAFQSAAPAGNDGGAAPAGPGPQALPDGTVLVLVDPAEVLPNPKQPRRHFDEGALAELAESIRRDGLQEPIIVRRAGDKYELVSGERKVITGNDGRPVKQPVALNTNGTKKAANQPPSVINDGDGVDIYPSAEFTTKFGTPTII